MNELQIFENKEFGSVRTLSINGNPYFVGKDVAEILGYANPSKALSDHVDEEDKLNNESLSSLGQRGGWLINESGLYSLILSSKLPTAKKFKYWVTSEVLPSIRKHGGYITGQEQMSSEELLSRALLFAQSKIEDRDRLIEKQTKVINELTPKAEYADTILDNKGLVTVTQIAKEYGMSGKELNNLLATMHVQYKQSGQWLLYAAHQSKGWTHSKTIAFNHSDGTPDIRLETKWTQKGKKAIYEMLKKYGILPVIER